MTIGAAWNVDNPEKPFADWDPDADIKIPIGLEDWLTVDLGTAYQSHQIITASPLVCEDAGTYTDGTVLVRMALIDGADYTEGTKYAFTVRVFGSDGTTQDDRTLFLKVKQR